MPSAAHHAGLRLTRLSPKARLEELLFNIDVSGCEAYDVLEDLEGALLSKNEISDVLKENPALISRIASSVSMLHVGMACRYPTVGKLLFEHTSDFRLADEHLPRIARKLLDNICSVDAKQVLESIRLRASFTTQRYRLRGQSDVTILEGALLLVQARLLQTEISAVITIGIVKYITSAFRLCRDILTLVHEKDPKFDAQPLINVEGSVPTEAIQHTVVDVDSTASTTNPCIDCVKRTPYGTATALFIRLHGKDAVQYDRSNAHKVLMNGEPQGEQSSINASKDLFAEHSGVLTQMDDTPEVQAAYANLPHPLLTTGMLFIVAVCLLGFADRTVANPPYLQATTSLVEERINGCMEDFHNDAPGFMSSMHKWSKRQPWIIGEDPGTKAFQECLRAVTCAVFMYRENGTVRNNVFTMRMAFDKVVCKNPTFAALVRNNTVVQNATFNSCSSPKYELDGTFERLSFPRALYFSTTLDKQGSRSFTEEPEEGSKLVIVTEMLIDYNVGPVATPPNQKTVLRDELSLRFSHRVVPLSTSPFFDGPSPWLGFGGCLCAFIAMTIGTIVHVVFDVSFLRWTWGSVKQPSDLEMLIRVTIVALEFTCVGACGYSLRLLSQICSLTKPKHMLWNDVEAEAVKQAGWYLRALMLVCLVPIAHGSLYCGHWLLSHGSLCFSVVLGSFLLFTGIGSSDTSRTEIHLDMHLGTNAVVLSAALCSGQAATLVRAKKIDLENKYYWIFQKSNFDLQQTWKSRLWILAAALVQVTTFMFVVLLNMWALYLLEDKALTERFDVIRQHERGGLSVVEDYVGVFIIGCTAVSYMMQLGLYIKSRWKS